jgi:hypothetical protein
LISQGEVNLQIEIINLMIRTRKQSEYGEVEEEVP